MENLHTVAYKLFYTNARLANLFKIQTVRVPPPRAYWFKPNFFSLGNGLKYQDWGAGKFFSGSGS